MIFAPNFIPRILRIRALAAGRARFFKNRLSKLISIFYQIWVPICIHFSTKNPSKIDQKPIKKATCTTTLPQDVPKTPQDAPKTRQDAPKTPQDGPRRLQDTPKTPQDAPKTPPKPPRTRPGGATKGEKNEDFRGSLLDPLLDRILVGFWKVFGRFLGGFWEVFGRIF